MRVPLRSRYVVVEEPITEAIVVGDSPGPSNQVRPGSLRNQINCRRA